MTELVWSYCNCRLGYCRSEGRIEKKAKVRPTSLMGNLLLSCALIFDGIGSLRRLICCPFLVDEDSSEMVRAGMARGL